MNEAIIENNRNILQPDRENLCSRVRTQQSHVRSAMPPASGPNIQRHCLKRCWQGRGLENSIERRQS